MTAVWDTTLASRLHPHAEALEYAIDQAGQGTPVRIAAPAILEIAYGYQRRASTDPRFGSLLAWLTRILASDAFDVVPLDGRAALVAGSVRGVLPHPPARRRDPRSKTMRQASWLMDIEIAATAFAAGLDVATDNREDFVVIAEALARLYPAADPLAVVAGPL